MLKNQCQLLISFGIGNILYNCKCLKLYCSIPFYSYFFISYFFILSSVPTDKSKVCIVYRNSMDKQGNIMQFERRVPPPTPVLTTSSYRLVQALHSQQSTLGLKNTDGSQIWFLIIVRFIPQVKSTTLPPPFTYAPSSPCQSTFPSIFRPVDSQHTPTIYLL